LLKLLPRLIANQIFRRPKFANEWLLWYFGSKDMGVAHTLSRTFFWSENILWKEDIVGRHVTVFLGGKDSIINAPLVRAYLQAGIRKEQQNDEYTSSRSEASEANHGPEKIVPSSGLIEDGQLNVVWCADLDHGQIFDLAVWRMRLKGEILAQARVGAIQY
jgi:hypothetical protein